MNVFSGDTCIPHYFPRLEPHPLEKGRNYIHKGTCRVMFMLGLAQSRVTGMSF